MKFVDFLNERDYILAKYNKINYMDHIMIHYYLDDESKEIEQLSGMKVLDVVRKLYINNKSNEMQNCNLSIDQIHFDKYFRIVNDSGKIYYQYVIVPKVFEKYLAYRKLVKKSTCPEKYDDEYEEIFDNCWKSYYNVEYVALKREVSIYNIQELIDSLEQANKGYNRCWIKNILTSNSKIYEKHIDSCSLSSIVENDYFKDCDFRKIKTNECVKMAVNYLFEKTKEDINKINEDYTKPITKEKIDDIHKSLSPIPASLER